MEIKCYIRNPHSRSIHQITWLNSLVVDIDGIDAVQIDRSATFDLTPAADSYTAAWAEFPGCHVRLPKQRCRVSRHGELAITRAYQVLKTHFQNVSNPKAVKKAVPVLTDPRGTCGNAVVLQGLKEQMRREQLAETSKLIAAKQATADRANSDAHQPENVLAQTIYAHCKSADGKWSVQQVSCDVSESVAVAALDAIWAQVAHWRTQVGGSLRTKGQRHFYDTFIKGFNGYITSSGSYLSDNQMVAGVYLLQTYSTPK
jgi:hypothetical protein